jgi:2-phosphoglycerate kinase
MEEARAAHHERWRREKDARGKRRMALVGGAATVGLSLLASVMARRPRRHAATSETE